MGKGEMVLPEGAKGLHEKKAAMNAFPGPKPEVDEAAVTAETETDVLVLGGGHAGLQVALAAAEEGARVCVVETKSLERLDWLGEQIGTFNSRFLTELGFGNYDLDDILDEYERCGGFQVSHGLLAKYVRNSGQMLDHVLSLVPEDSDLLDPSQFNIHEAYGKPDYPIVRGGYRTWASTIQFRGPVIDTRDVNYPVGKFSRLRELCRIVMERGQALGAKWYCGHRAAVLTQDGTGRVTGALAERPEGGYIRFRARAVADCLGNLSDLGLRLGVWAGGHLDNTPVKPVQCRIPGDASRAFGQTAFLMLNAQGKRFVNESVPYALSPAMERQPGDFVTIVTDRKWLDQVRLCPVHHGCPDFGRPEYIRQAQEDMEQVVRHGAQGYEVRSCSFSEREQALMYGADTLEELAGYLGYAGQARKNWLDSIARYNELCRAGRDADFGKDPDTLLPIDQGPFYGCVTRLERRDWDGREAHLGGLNGLHTDDDFNVLDKELRPIPGLYAAGNTLGYRYSVFYPTPCGGSFIGSAMTHGRLLGKQLAAL